MGRKSLIGAVLLISGRIFVACEDFPTGDVSCDLRPGESMCQQVAYPLQNKDMRAVLVSECEDELSGIPSEEECTLVDSVGSCVAVDPEILLGDPENGDETYIVYYEGFEDPEEHCEDHGGRFSPPE